MTMFVRLILKCIIIQILITWVNSFESGATSKKTIGAVRLVLTRIGITSYCSKLLGTFGGAKQQKIVIFVEKFIKQNKLCPNYSECLE
jgi:hypothetical protein